MIACLRPLSALCLAGLLAACASSPSSSLGELPRTPDASIEQLLQQASTAKPEQAASLRLSAADLAYKQQDIGRSARILEQIPLDSLKPAQQVFASTLSAELAMTRRVAESAELGAEPGALAYSRANAKLYVALPGQGRIVKLSSARSLQTSPYPIDQFGIDAQINNQPVFLDYYVVRQSKGGATLSGRYAPAQATALQRDVERIAKSIALNLK